MLFGAIEMSFAQPRPFSADRAAGTRWNELYNTSAADRTPVFFQNEPLPGGSLYLNGKKVEVYQQTAAAYEEHLLTGIREAGGGATASQAVRQFLDDVRAIMSAKGAGGRTLGQLRWLKAEASRFRYRSTVRASAKPLTAAVSVDAKDAATPKAADVSTAAKPAFAAFVSDIASRVRAIPAGRIGGWREKAGLYLKAGQADDVAGRFDLGAPEEGGKPRRLADTRREYAAATFTVLYDEMQLEDSFLTAKTDEEFDAYHALKKENGGHPELTAAQEKSEEFRKLKIFADSIKADKAQIALLQDYTGGFYNVVNAALRAGANTTEALGALEPYRAWASDNNNAGAAEVCQKIVKTCAAFDAVAVELPKGITLHRALDAHRSFPKTALDTLAGAVLQDPAFTSAAYGTGPTGRFADYSIQLHLHVTEGVRGVPAAPFSLNPAENEIILAPDTRFLVLGTQVDEDGRHHVDMAVLPTHGPAE